MYIQFIYIIYCNAQLDINSAGYVGIGCPNPSSQLQLGFWNGGSAGADYGNQLTLSGPHNKGANKGGKKLVIEGYDNNGSVVYPIYLRDENQYVDFWIKNRPSASSLPSMYFAGNMGIGVNPSYKLDVKGGQIRISPDGSSSSNPFYFTNYGSDPCLTSSDNYGVLGKPDKELYRIYAKAIYMGGSLVSTSDMRAKENIKSVGKTLDKIKNLNPVKYDFITPNDTSITKEKKEKIRKENKNNIGFIAQEVLKDFPDLVEYNEDTELYGIKYLEFIPLLVQSIKEQQIIIDQMQKEIEKLQNGAKK